MGVQEWKKHPGLCFSRAPFGSDATSAPDTIVGPQGRPRMVSRQDLPFDVHLLHWGDRRFDAPAWDLRFAALPPSWGDACAQLCSFAHANSHLALIRGSVPRAWPL